MGNTRDYYADLELPPSADVQDVKKQFRKLALKYHPDRNPGREQEVNSKFQLIQSAHEVLADPTQKAKYDATLGRNRYPASSGVKGNPWSNAGQQFPPPPRRGQPNRHPPPQPSGAGAQRWQSRFSSGVPPTAKQYPSGDPEAKKNAARAFENMRKSQSQASSQAHPKTATRDSRPPPPPPPPRSETAKQRAQASFGNRKSGFYPRSSMPGDEPPVTSKNYSSRSTAERTEPETAEPRRAPPGPIPDPLSQFRDRDRDYVDPRQSTPYTTHGGEKTNPFDGVPLGRAKSNRERSRPDGSAASDTSSPGQKNRSSSVPKTAAKDDAAPGLSVPEDDQRPHTADESTGAYTKASFKTRANAKYSPGGATTSARGGSSSDTPGKGQGRSGSGPSMYDTPQKNNSHHTPSSVDGTDYTTPKTKSSVALHDLDRAGPFKASLHDSPLNHAPSGDHITSHRSIPFEKQQHELLDRLISNAGASLPVEKRNYRNTISNKPSSEELANISYSNSFSFSVDDDTFAQTSPDHGSFGRSSVDDINTQFVNDEGLSEWRFNAGSGEPSANQANQSRSRKGPRSPTKRPTVRQSDANETNDQPPRSESGFNADGWSDKFGPQTFVPQATPGTSSSPTRSNRASTKKSKAAKPTAGNAAVVDDTSSDEEAYEWRGRKAQAQAAEMDSPQAMDIDSPPAAPAANSPQPNDVRNIFVEPSRPDWRQGTADGVNGGVPAAEETGKNRPNPNAAGSEDSEEFRASLGDLRNVEPFAPPQSSGLKSFGDLKDNLPFDSKASNDISIKLPKATPLLFPSPPEAPHRPPTVAINGMKPNMSSWMKYVGEFENYLKAWDDFNAQVVDHFATRKAHISNTRTEKGYAFLAARGDADIQEYYNSVQQDNDVRRRWREACEEHEQRFREFMAFREKMKAV